jgi:hypothetical protein
MIAFSLLIDGSSDKQYQVESSLLTAMTGKKKQ